MAGGNARCGVNYFCMGAFLIFLGSVLLCALGFTILLPYAATRDWPEVSCEVINSSYDHQQCMCDQKIYDGDVSCVTRYPCLQITVQYSLPRHLLDNTTSRHGIPHPEADLTTVIYHYQDEDSNNRKRSHSRLYKTLTQAKTPESNTVDKWEGETRTGSSSDRKHVSSGVNTGFTDTDKTFTTAGGHTAGTRQNSEQPDSHRRVQTGVQTGAQTGAQTGTQTGSKIDYTHGTDSETDRDPPHVNVDSRSTLPYSGPAITSDANIITDTSNATGSDVIWLTRTIYRGWSDAFYGQCSLHECGVQEWNVKEVANFKKIWATIGQRLVCYYRTDRPEVVILEKTPEDVMMHAILWPCMCLAGGWLLWLGLCIGCCSIDNGEAYAS